MGTAVLSGAFVEGAAPESGVQDRAAIRLWAAVFAQGVEDCAQSLRALSVAPAPHAPTPRYIEALQDRRWLFSRADSPGSFVWLCRLFNRNPRSVRGKIMDSIDDAPMYVKPERVWGKPGKHDEHAE